MKWHDLVSHENEKGDVKSGLFMETDLRKLY